MISVTNIFDIFTYIFVWLLNTISAMLIFVVKVEVTVWAMLVVVVAGIVVVVVDGFSVVVTILFEYM